MRFLHTSDWHIGKGLRGAQRWPECEAALGQVLDIAHQEGVDCLLMAGDLFDSSAPPPEAERLLFEFFRELWGRRIPAVVVGGNHDHPRRLAALSRLLDLVGIHLRSEPAMSEDGGVVHIQSRDGREMAVIATLPWVPERKVVEFETFLTGEGRPYQQYADGVAEMARWLAKSFRTDTVSILLAHLMVDGGKVGGGERELHIGETYAVSQQTLPQSAQYLALGHLHRAQKLTGTVAEAHYAGSLLQLDFGEREQAKSVVIVHASPGRPARVETLPITAGRELRDVEGTLEELEALAAEVGDAYLRVRVRLPGPVPNLAEQVREALPNAMEIAPRYPVQLEEKRPERLSVGGPPEKLLSTYYRETYGSKLPEPVENLLRRLLEEAQREAP
jgi:exonuclease SbcD